jgi:UDP-N-acetylmuramoyl-tripeptide--D-alanyl-D-alanine ligase
MKEVLKAVLGFRFQVFATPESVNTPVGIARWVLKNFNAPNPSSAPQAPSPLKGEGNIEIAIIEMGEHYKGDIKAICSLVKPDMAVVTGINEAHLERMGSIKAVTQTIFEIVQYAKPDALCFLNGDDKNVVENYQNYILPKQKNIKYQISNIKHAKFDAVRLGWELEIPPLAPPNIGGEEARGNTNIGEEGERGNFNSGGEGERGNSNSRGEGEGVKIFVKLLGEYALGDVDCAISIARELGMSNEAIKQGIEKIQPVKHRLEPILRPGNILVIDDAYNGNSVGVKEAIKTLARFPNRRKIYITPGLVETGSEVKTVHLEIGKQLAKVADVVILIRNSVTGYIELGIKNYELSKRENLQLTTYNLPIIMWFNSAGEAHAELKHLLQPNDVILFQNDWGDQYI